MSDRGAGGAGDWREDASARMREQRDLALRAYHLNICDALVSYLDAARPLRVRGTREENKLVLTFVVEDADTFHELLEEVDGAER